MFVVILARVGVRAAPGVLIVPLQQAFGWSAGDDLGRGVAEHPAVRAGRAVRRRADADDRHAADHAGVAGRCWWWARAERVRRRSIWQLYLTWGVLVGLGLGRRDGRAGDGGRQPLVRRAARAGGRAADRQQRQRTTGFPARCWRACRVARLAQRALVVALVILALMPVVLLLLAESPGFGRAWAVRGGREPPTLPPPPAIRS